VVAAVIDDRPSPHSRAALGSATGQAVGPSPFRHRPRGRREGRAPHPLRRRLAL